MTVDVHGKGSLGARVLEQAVGDGSACPLKGLLTRLEQQLHRGVGLHKLGLAGLEQTGRAEQGRRVHIVATSVHAAVGRSERLARFLGNGQGIHVERGMGDVHLVQTRLDIGRRLRKIVTELGHLMEIVAPCGKLTGKCLGFFDQAFADSGLRRCSSLRRWLRLKIGQSWCHRCPPVTFLQHAL